VNGDVVGGTADDLVRARARLLTPAPGQRRLAPGALREALTDLHEFWLAAHATAAGVPPDGGGVALVAVGALGRRGLVPYSDLDLVLVHDGRQDVEAIAEKLWYPLWNAGIGLDHSVRTVGEALGVAESDLRTALGLLEARHLVGDTDVSGRLAAAARQAWRAGIRNRLDELTESARRRWARSGEVAYRVEPDLKHGHGGLRDLHLLDALSIAQLIDRPGAELAETGRLLLDVRTELRRVAGRARDVLHAQDGDEVAGALGMADRFELARALSSAGRTVVYALDVALRAARGALPARRGLVGFGRSALRRGPARRPLDEGVVLHGEPDRGAEVTLAREAAPGRDPALLLRVAAAAARSRHPIAAGTLATLADCAPELRRPWPAAAREELVALLGTGQGLVDVVEALDRTGLWGRLFPEWGWVRDLPPQDAAHVWTVDRHLIQATAQAGRLVTTVSRPDLLLLGALLHDIGKGRDADHSVVGAALAAEVGARLGLPQRDVDTLCALVRHHLLLPHTATRRDVDDPATVHRVVEALGGDLQLLELLGALAEADSLATGPGVWNDWKATLIADLVDRCRSVLAGEPLPKPEPLDDDQRRLADAVAASGRPDVLVTRDDHAATVTVVAPDRPGLLSRAAGVLALNLLEVHSAVLRSHAGVAVDVFGVSPRFGSPPDPALLREQVTRAVDGRLPLADLLAAKERDYGGGPEIDAPTPRALWFDDEATGAVVLELRATDRIGLLHRVAAALESCGVNVRWAKVATLGGTVVDSFCLTLEPGDGEPPAGRGMPAVALRGRVERAVLAAAR
jgi:[protein-PII] uridylyltransferase